MNILPSKNGFTLLEVIISISLIAVVLASLFRMQSQTIELATANKFNIIAPALSRKLISAIEENLFDWTQTQGDFKPDYPNVNWTVSLSDSRFEHLDFIGIPFQNGLKKIHITITDPSRQQSYSLTTWRLAIE